MKKLLLSSLIMFGVCGFAFAQESGAKFKKAEAATAPQASFTTAPQSQAAVTASDAVVAPSDAAVAADVAGDSKPTSPQTIEEKKRAAHAAANPQAAVAVVGTDGVVISPAELKKQKIEKAEAAKKAKDN